MSEHDKLESYFNLFELHKKFMKMLSIPLDKLTEEEIDEIDMFFKKYAYKYDRIKRKGF